MSTTTRRHIKRFPAAAADGSTYMLDLFQHFISVRTRGGSTEAPGIKEIFTADGQNVNRIEKGVYEILEEENLRVTSDDPDAP